VAINVKPVLWMREKEVTRWRRISEPMLARGGQKARDDHGDMAKFPRVGLDERRQTEGQLHGVQDALSCGQLGVSELLKSK
jgi:hypothetical protein